MQRDHGAVIVNFDEKGKPAEIEILNAYSKVMGDIFAAIVKAKTGETLRNNSPKQAAGS